MKTFIKKVAIQLLFLSLVACAPPPPASAETDTKNSPFQQLYNSLLDSTNYQSQVDFDTEIHEYTFMMSHSGNICAIGYQSLPTITGIPYTIELLNRENKVLFSGNFTFTAGNTFYISINHIPIDANQPYTFRRIISLKNVGNKYNNLMGKTILKKDDIIHFPITYGDITIIASNFYQNGGPLPDAGIPFIDFGYIENQQ